MDRIISKISFDHKAKSAVVLFNTNETLNLSLDLVGKFNIRRGSLINSDTFDEICYEQEVIEAKNIAMNFVSYRQRTTVEVESKLQSLNYEPRVIQKVIEFLCHFGYLNDEKFALAYVKEKMQFKKMSFRRIQQELLRKGIKKEILEVIQQQIEWLNAEKENARHLATKKYQTLGYGTQDVEKERKIINYLLQKGFEYSLVKEVVKEITEGLTSAHPEGLEPPTL